MVYQLLQDLDIPFSEMFDRRLFMERLTIRPMHTELSISHNAIDVQEVASLSTRAKIGSGRFVCQAKELFIGERLRGLPHIIKADLSLWQGLELCHLRCIGAQIAQHSVSYPATRTAAQALSGCLKYFIDTLKPFEIQHDRGNGREPAN